MCNLSFSSLSIAAVQMKVLKGYERHWQIQPGFRRCLWSSGCSLGPSNSLFAFAAAAAAVLLSFCLVSLCCVASLRSAYYSHMRHARVLVSFHSRP